MKVTAFSMNLRLKSLLFLIVFFLKFNLGFFGFITDPVCLYDGVILMSVRDVGQCGSVMDRQQEFPIIIMMMMECTKQRYLREL